MATNIGELFISLGFDVDDKTLKGFNDEIKNAASGMLKLAGVTASVAGFGAILTGASDAAIRLRNLTAEFGYSARGAQEWAAVLHQVNPLVSLEQGVSSYQKIAEYILSVQKGGGAFALNALGVQWKDGMTPEDIIRGLQAGLPGAINNWGRGRTNDFLREITSDVSSINALNLSLEEYDRLKTRIVSDNDLDNLDKYAKSMSELNTQWDIYLRHITAAVAPTITNNLNAANKGGLLGWIDWVGENSYLPGLVEWAGKNSYLPSAKTVLGAAGSLNNAGARDSVLSFFQKRGWSEDQSQGILDRLTKESSLNPQAVGDNGSAYGLAQWHPSRQYDFARWANHSIKDSTFFEQLGFINYELTEGNERKAGDALRKTRSRTEAYDSFTKNYERPAVVQNNTINVHTAANAQQTAEEINRVVQQHFSYAYSQANQGAAF